MTSPSRPATPATSTVVESWSYSDPDLNDTSMVFHRNYRGQYVSARNTAGNAPGITTPYPGDPDVARSLNGGTVGPYGSYDPNATFTWVGSLPMGQRGRDRAQPRVVVVALTVVVGFLSVATSRWARVQPNPRHAVARPCGR